jgi:hypothetical protein
VPTCTLAAAPRAHPEDVAASKSVQEAAQKAAQPSTATAGRGVAPPADPELAALAQEADALYQQLDALPLAADERAELDAARKSVADADAEARATAQAALCMVGIR